VVRLVVTGGSLSRRPKRSLRCLLVEAPSQINEDLNLNINENSRHKITWKSCPHQPETNSGIEVAAIS